MPDNIEDDKPQRIAKVIARAGICSRREAEKLILQGVVSVNGKKLDSPAFTVTPKDEIVVNGKPLQTKEDIKLLLFHKPSGCLTTHKDPEGRKTIFDILPKDSPHLMSVGRLDYNTEGLLLLTNDGEFSRHMELPDTALTRTYRVRAYGKISQTKLDELGKGLAIQGVQYKPILAKLERQQGQNAWIQMSIQEGKNREIRRVMEHLGLDVNRLIRISYGPFLLGGLPKGQLKEVSNKVLKKQFPQFF